MKNPHSLPALPLLLITLFLLAACAMGPRPDGQSLYPAAHNEKGYSSIGRDHLFEDERVRISVRHLKKGEARSGPLIDGLIEKEYAVFRLDIFNKSKAGVMYNTAYTALTSSALDYRKPLDFTDLYDITGDYAVLSHLKGKFYDLNSTVAPGERASRLLIFRPLAAEAVNAKVAIKDIYVGTATLDLSFPFIFKGDEPE